MKNVEYHFTDRITVHLRWLTDAPPRKANLTGFLQSERIRTLELPLRSTRQNSNGKGAENELS
ncbi:MAG: hypothetical protein DMG97_44050 [Acidobacteria bacterium]|nr:MAG: hypothetical protein DMG97_44050 [Acidobacteriota bacterium]